MSQAVFAALVMAVPWGAHLRGAPPIVDEKAAATAARPASQKASQMTPPTNTATPSTNGASSVTNAAPWAHMATVAQKRTFLAV